MKREMSRWTKNYDQQEIEKALQSCLTTLEAANIEKLSEQDLREYARLLKVLKYLSARFAAMDPELFPLKTWSNFSGWLGEAHNNLLSFSQNGVAGHIQNANASIDNILGVLRPHEGGVMEVDLPSISEAALGFQNKILEELERVRSRRGETEIQLAALGDAISETRSRVEETNHVIQQQKARLDQSIAEFQKQFSAAQETRTREFAELLKKGADGFSAQAHSIDSQTAQINAERKEQYDKFFAEAAKEADSHRALLKSREDEVNKIFGAIGSTAFAGVFKTTADSEAYSANQWRWIALGLMAAMILVGGYAFYYSIGHETDWRVFAFRLGTVIVLAVPAVYAANESSKHRERERLNRKVHLELASIDAYLVLLPEGERNRIKGSMAEKFFGVPLTEARADELSRKDLFGVITSVLNNLTKGK